FRSSAPTSTAACWATFRVTARASTRNWSVPARPGFTIGTSSTTPFTPCKMKPNRPGAGYGRNATPKHRGAGVIGSAATTEENTCRPTTHLTLPPCYHYEQGQVAYGPGTLRPLIRFCRHLRLRPMQYWAALPPTDVPLSHGDRYQCPATLREG